MTTSLPLRLPHRRTVVAGLAACGLLRVGPSRAEPPALRVGVLRFGTVAWELDVMRQHGLDRAAGVTVEPVEFASSQATDVALQARAVDLIAQDWLWVSRQRSAGADFTFAPLSNAVGAIEAPFGSSIAGVGDLVGKRLGVAGTPIDKSWLILRAYARRQFGIDLGRAADIQFAPPPLLEQQMAAARLDAVLTFWPFAARAEAAGARRVISIEEVLGGLGISPGVPIVGYVFSDSWARLQSGAIEGFLGAARQARQILLRSDEEWQRIAALTGAADGAVLERLKAWYRHGVPDVFGATERQAAEDLWRILSDIGGTALTGTEAALAPGTFWSAA